ncbi:LacI family transcriptional regulator [Marinimicrobium koreense]|uniref:LacI family transcriptional regulator n=1 Tax=Marinimicrobium koreense TaxID=306545 RepID=A0A3N1NT05_9GAMM|nr:LacI family DNA-binding transcriptional regulator [Marinimicrobium koreense]ROQ18318.1 LacI family transcriptional regulator [Marinimicrobium koreense]
MSRRKPQEPVSIADIARRAGVSESTVSRALNNNPAVNIKTREKVQALAREMNYKVNTGARNLRLQRSHTIALVINAESVDGQTFSDPFMMDMIGAIADELNEHQYSLLFSSNAVSPEDWHAHLLGSRRADGIIVIGQGRDDAPLRQLQKEGDAIVVWGAREPEANYCIVGSDNYMGGQLASRHLIGRGCRRMLFLGDVAHPEIQGRFQGYFDALTEAGLSSQEHHVQAAFSIESGYQHVVDLLEEGLDFDGIFAASDNIAMGAIKALQEKGIRVPDDVAVVGFDDIPIAPYFNPPLTTVRQDIHRGGKLLVQKVMALVKGQPVTSEVLKTELVVRASS